MGFVLLLPALGGQHPSVGTPDYWIPEELFVRPSFKVGCCFFKIKKNVEKNQQFRLERLYNSKFLVSVKLNHINEKWLSLERGDDL